jgi:hypothetical protein
MSLHIIIRNIKYWFQRRTRGWSDDETWNLNYEFILWSNSRFKKYREQAVKMVDLEYYKFEYKDKIYTQLQVIDRIIELTDYIINNDYYEMMWSDIERLEAMKNEIFDLFKMSFGAMWW